MGARAGVMVEELESHRGVTSRPAPEHIAMQKLERIGTIEGQQSRPLTGEERRHIPTDGVRRSEKLAERQSFAMGVQVAGQQGRAAACGSEDDEPPIVRATGNGAQIEHGARQGIPARARAAQKTEAAHLAQALGCSWRPGRGRSCEENIRANSPSARSSWAGVPRSATRPASSTIT